MIITAILGILIAIVLVVLACEIGAIFAGWIYESYGKRGRK